MLTSACVFAQNLGSSEELPVLNSAPLKAYTAPESLTQYYVYDPSSLEAITYSLGSPSLSDTAISITSEYLSQQNPDLSEFLSSDDLTGIGYFCSCLTDSQLSEILSAYPFLNNPFSRTPFYKICMSAYQNMDDYKGSVTRALSQAEKFESVRKVVYGLTGKTIDVVGKNTSYNNVFRKVTYYDQTQNDYKEGFIIPNEVIFRAHNCAVYWGPIDKLKNADGTTNMNLPIMDFCFTAAANVEVSCTLYLKDSPSAAFLPYTFTASQTRYHVGATKDLSLYNEETADSSQSESVLNGQRRYHPLVGHPVYDDDQGISFYSFASGREKPYSTGLTPQILSDAGLFFDNTPSHSLQINQTKYSDEYAWIPENISMPREFYGLYTDDFGYKAPDFNYTRTSNPVKFKPNELFVLFDYKYQGNSMNNAPQRTSTYNYLYRNFDAEDGNAKAYMICLPASDTIDYTVVWNYDDEYSQPGKEYTVSQNDIIKDERTPKDTAKKRTQKAYYNNYNHITRQTVDQRTEDTYLSRTKTTNISFDTGSDLHIDPVTKTYTVKAAWRQKNTPQGQDPIIFDLSQQRVQTNIYGVVTGYTNRPSYVNLCDRQDDVIEFERYLPDFLETSFEQELPRIDRPGYIFNGWMDQYGNNYSPLMSKYVFEYGKEYQLTAQFTPMSYKVRIFGMKQNGARDTEYMAEYNCKVGQENIIPTPQVENYTFAGYNDVQFYRYPDTYIYTPTDLSDEAYYDKDSFIWQKYPQINNYVNTDQTGCVIKVDSLNPIILENHASAIRFAILDADDTYDFFKQTMYSFPVQDYKTTNSAWTVFHDHTFTDIEKELTAAFSITNNLRASKYSYYNSNGAVYEYTPGQTYARRVGKTFIDTGIVSWVCKDPSTIIPAFNNQIINIYPSFIKNIPEKYQVIYQAENGDILHTDECNKNTNYYTKSAAQIGIPSKTGYVPYYTLTDGTIKDVGQTIEMDDNKILLVRYKPVNLNLKLYNASSSEDDLWNESPAKEESLPYDESISVAEFLEDVNLTNQAVSSVSSAAFVVGLSTMQDDVDILVNPENGYEDLSDEYISMDDVIKNPRTYSGLIREGEDVELYPVWSLAAKYKINIYQEKEEYEDENDKYELIETVEETDRAYSSVTVTPSYFEGFITPSAQTINSLVPKMVNGQLQAVSSVSLYYDRQPVEKDPVWAHIGDETDKKMQNGLRQSQEYQQQQAGVISLETMAFRAQNVLDGETDEDYIADLTTLKEAYADSFEKETLSQALLDLSSGKTSGYEKVCALYEYYKSVSTGANSINVDTLLALYSSADTNIKKYQFIYLAYWYKEAFAKVSIYEDYQQAAETVFTRGSTACSEITDLLQSYKQSTQGFEQPVNIVVEHRIMTDLSGIVYKTEYFVKEKGSQFTPSLLTEEMQECIDAENDFLPQGQYEIIPPKADAIETYTVNSDMVISVLYRLKEKEQTQPLDETYKLQIKYVVTEDADDLTGAVLLETVEKELEKDSSYQITNLEDYEAKVKAKYPGRDIVITLPTLQTVSMDQNRIVTVPYLVSDRVVSYTATVNYKATYKEETVNISSKQTTIAAGSSFTPQRLDNDETILKERFGQDIEISIPDVETIKNVSGNIVVNYIYAIADKPQQDPDDPPTDKVTVSISYKVSVDGQETVIGSKQMEAEKGKLLQIPGFDAIETYVSEHYSGKEIAYPEAMTLTPSADADVSVIYILSDPKPAPVLTVKHIANLWDGTSRQIATETISSYTGNAPMLTAEEIKSAITGYDIQIAFPEDVYCDGTKDQEVTYRYTITLKEQPQSNYHIIYKATASGNTVTLTETDKPQSQVDITNVPDPDNLLQLIGDIDTRAQVADRAVSVENTNITVTYTLAIMHKIKIYHVFVTENDRIQIAVTNVEGADTYNAKPLTRQELDEKIPGIASVTIPKETQIDLTKDQDYTFEYVGSMQQSVSENTVDVHISYYGCLDDNRTKIGEKNITAPNDRDIKLPDLENWQEKLKELFGDVILPDGTDAVITPEPNVSTIEYEISYTAIKKSVPAPMVNVTLHHVAYQADGTLFALGDTFLKGSKGSTLVAKPLTQQDIQNIFQNAKIESITFPESYSIYLDKDMEKYMYYTVLLEGGKAPIIDSGTTDPSGKEQTQPQDANDTKENNNNDTKEDTKEETTTVTFKENSDGTVSITDIDTSADTVTIPSTVEKDGKVYKVKEVPASLAGSDIKDIEIEDGIVSIAKGAFDGCKNLESITIPSSVKVIGDQSFKNTVSLTDITLPNGITKIGKETFAGSGIKQLNIPSSVTEIGQKAFAGSKLTTVSLPKVKTIGKEAFKKAPLTKVTLGSAKTIGDKAFEGTKLKTITIPKNVTKVGKNAFKNCKKLKTVKIKSKKIKSFGKGTFSGIYKKAKIYLPKSKFAKYKKMLKGKVPKTVKFKKQ